MISSREILPHLTSEQLHTAESFVQKAYGEGQSSQGAIHVEIEDAGKNPYDKPLVAERTVALESFDRQGEKIIIVNPCHGNEPYILATDVALSINKLLESEGKPKAKIVVPLIYGQRQEAILKENFSGHTDEIFLDERLGQFYKEVLFQNGKFDEHLATMVVNQSRVQDLVMDYMSRNFVAISLATGEITDFNGRDVVMDINAGSRFITHQDSYFVFPALLSELLEETAKSGLPFNHDHLEVVQKAARERESTYRAKFLPHIHTFSYQDEDYPKEGKSFTPPLKHPTTHPPGIEEEGVYVMASGTGSEVDNVTTNAKDLGLTVYRSPFINLDYGKAALPDVIYHPNIVAVFGRMGWGTGWITQQAEKPFIVVPYTAPDDPEIYFNIKTLREKKLGVVYEGQKDIVKQALTLVGDIKAINQQIESTYGTRDGIDYVARRIVDDFHQKRGLPTI